jgi:hypothetical protein
VIHRSNTLRRDDGGPIKDALRGVFYWSSERLRVGIAALKRVFKCSLATANCALKTLFALHYSSSLALDRWEAEIATSKASRLNFTA